jgi:hypothetical protein
LSSTFSEGDDFSNNNGNQILGYLDPYHPMLDKASSDFDIRQRLSVTAVWAIPAYKSGKGIMHQIFGGWEVAPIFTARKGSPYSLFDSGISFNYGARASLLGSVGPDGNGNPESADTNPNLFNFLNIPNSIITHALNPVYGYNDLPPFPATMTGRNVFTAPGFWNLDLGAYKNFSLSERFKLQLRGEAFNVVNHANLYLLGASTDLAVAPAGESGVTSINACRGCTANANPQITTSNNDRRNLQLAVKLIF